MTTRQTKTSTSVKTRRAASGRVLGVTKDGVQIRDPGRATHFTHKEVRDAIRLVKAAERVG